MKINLNRVLIFLSVVLIVGLSLQQCWQSKPLHEKWLYLFDEPAREYAARVLGPDRGTGLAPPEPLSDMEVRVDAEAGYVVFASDMFSGESGPKLLMAFSPGGQPPQPRDRPGFGWAAVGNGWYQLRPAP